ncbi:alpha/beta family hydrolase [Microbaculum marinisediminis]|uniref:Alpha/beta hydrolase n=1 Tax=Microbaculum marinisediminis TaxID=2931392 RepID=A0AAW5QRJ0_9HYPH|nr:alpha/beta family hydrolase [Microbaculum sp. A6E488]MCT8970701.1 alpha/beta hydrolase [Microbaculum sp. A6E488]
MTEPNTSVETLLWDRPATRPAHATLLLAHGAGVGMDSPFMAGIAGRLAERGVAVARFEFAYMAARRTGGKKRPPPRAEKLVDEYLAAIEAATAEGIDGPLLIGGKSLGGRVAAMAAGQPTIAAAGVVCLGYPFHPPGQPDAQRLTPLQDAHLPVLICQGDRDPFGAAAEVAGYGLPGHVRVAYLEDGDHDFKPRGRSPATWKGNLDAAAQTVTEFAAALG